MALLTQDQDTTRAMRRFPTKGPTKILTQVALLAQNNKETSLSMALLTQIGETRLAHLTNEYAITAVMAHLTQIEPSALSNHRGDQVEVVGHDEEQAEASGKQQAIDEQENPLSMQPPPSSTGYFAQYNNWQRETPENWGRTHGATNLCRELGVPPVTAHVSS